MPRIVDFIPNLRNRLLKRIWHRQREQHLAQTAEQPRHQLAVCAIFKNEAPYLREWIEFHRLVGVEKFFLYNNRSADDYQSVLAPYLCSGLVELRDWRRRPGQMSAYNHCLILNGPRARWITFLDIDEFLFSVQGTDLRDVLQDFEDYVAVAVHWVFFGTSGHIHQPQGLVVENFRHSQGVANRHVKLIIDPTKIKWMSTPHEGLFWNGARAVDERIEPVTSGIPLPATAERLRINHYWSKSVEEYVMQKMRRGRADTLRKDHRHSLTGFFRQESAVTQEEDTAIQQFLPALKQALSEVETYNANRD